MTDGKLRLAAYGRQAFEELSRAKDPDAALLYAFAASRGGSFDEKEAECELGFDSGRAKRAASLLCLYGLAAGRTEAEPEPASPKEISEARDKDMVFANLCSYLEAAVGRILRRTELETLYNVYGNLGLPADVLVLLINFCKETRKLSAREIERQAYDWHDQGIDSYTRAESYLESRRSHARRSWAIRRLLGIQDRKPSDSETRYIDDWVEKGVPDELIRLAYDRTVTRTGKLSWAYIDKILQNWRQKGIKTAKQVEELDRPRTPADQASEREQSIESAVRKRFDSRRRQREQRLKQRLEELTAQSVEFFELEKQRRLCSSRLARSSGGQKPAVEAELLELGQARQALLAKLGRPADWLDDKPVCAKCGDRGYIGAEMCECFRHECEREKGQGENIND